jgi:hypothetical protein
MRHREAGDARERKLDDGDLADEADDHHERQADDHAEQRVDRRLPEVVGEDDQRDHADHERDRARPKQPLRPRRERQASLDELAAAGQRGSSPEHGEDDDEEDEQLGHATHRAAAGVGREPGLGRHVLDERLADADREPCEGGDEERREPG